MVPQGPHAWLAEISEAGHPTPDVGGPKALGGRVLQINQSDLNGPVCSALKSQSNIKEQLFQGALKAYMQRAAVVSENFPFHVLIEMGMLNVISSM